MVDRFQGYSDVLNYQRLQGIERMTTTFVSFQAQEGHVNDVGELPTNTTHFLLFVDERSHIKHFQILAISNRNTKITLVACCVL